LGKQDKIGGAFVSATGVVAAAAAAVAVAVAVTVTVT